jgi:hypothetical protein
VVSKEFYDLLQGKSGPELSVGLPETEELHGLGAVQFYRLPMSELEKQAGKA